MFSSFVKNLEKSNKILLFCIIPQQTYDIISVINTDEMSILTYKKVRYKNKKLKKTEIARKIMNPMKY